MIGIYAMKYFIINELNLIEKQEEKKIFRSRDTQMKIDKQRFRIKIKSGQNLKKKNQ